ncbi:MAG: hypothetical protein IBX72_04795 [Nitrospirae bacterium]|jgi:uncharacterized membrane protein|nr:hypothetical protein [Nitrospirota bacterium]
MHISIHATALLKNEDVFYTNISIDDGIKIILSGGITTPERIPGAL